MVVSNNPNNRRKTQVDITVFDTDSEYQADTSTEVTWIQPYDTTTGWANAIRKPEVGGIPPTLKLNDNVKIKLKKGKIVNGKVKSINRIGFIDVTINGKNYLCVWKYNHWQEK